jgi:hypothetical protein
MFSRVFKAGVADDKEVNGVKRDTKNQAAHDKRVAEIAQRLKGQGWDVEADISGFDQPSPIGKDKRIPDIKATKAGAKRLIEVETPDTKDAHSDQHETFRRSASQQKRTSFTVEETEGE